MNEGSDVTRAPVERARWAVAWQLAPLGVAVGSLALGAIALGSRAITTDEAASIARADGQLGDVLTTIVNDAPGEAGSLLVLRLAMTVGNDELALRAPSAIAVALAAGLMVVLGTMLLGRVGGLVAGVALAANAGVVVASREARPYALGILGIVIATLLLVEALERGGGWWWVLYALAAATLPLYHPLAASVLAAHGAALIARRDRADLRTAGISLLAGTVFATGLLIWMAADRFSASAPEDLDLTSLGREIVAAGGWNPALGAAAVAGIVFLLRDAQSDSPGRWIGVLVSGLIAAPPIVTLLTAVGLPVHAGALVLCAPGVALAVGAVVLLLSPTRGLVAAGLAILLIASGTTIVVQLRQPVSEDWRALAAAVKSVKGPNETVIVLPGGSRAALAYYAPYLPTLRFARGDGVWVAVRAETAEEAIAASRPSVTTPRYALLRQFKYGDELRLQHWVRP
ncbi:glycosyltransferase family 39 protein [Gaiella sp.]|uniref:glycosyltransferase family 39 protein n=1 Tax=Gaiella sp. TaxID=2663207 RepID=UPI003264EAD3